MAKVTIYIPSTLSRYLLPCCFSCNPLVVWRLDQSSRLSQDNIIDYTCWCCCIVSYGFYNTTPNVDVHYLLMWGKIYFYWSINILVSLPSQQALFRSDKGQNCALLQEHRQGRKGCLYFRGLCPLWSPIFFEPHPCDRAEQGRQIQGPSGLLRLSHLRPRVSPNSIWQPTIYLASGDASWERQLDCHDQQVWLCSLSFLRLS